jgi:hypothetical protein
VNVLFGRVERKRTCLVTSLNLVKAFNQKSGIVFGHDSLFPEHDRMSAAAPHIVGYQHVVARRKPFDIPAGYKLDKFLVRTFLKPRSP